MAPISLKRSTPSHSDDDNIDEPETKRRRFVETLPQTPPPEEDLSPVSSKRRMFDEDPHQLLLRSIALALEHVGFAAATPESLEALCAEVETCSCTPACSAAKADPSRRGALSFQSDLFYAQCKKITANAPRLQVRSRGVRLTRGLHRATSSPADSSIQVTHPT